MIRHGNLLTFKEVVPLIFRNEAVSWSFRALVLLHQVLDVLGILDLLNLLVAGGVHGSLPERSEMKGVCRISTRSSLGASMDVKREHVDSAFSSHSIFT